jgi:hypothetical protein
MECEQGLRKAEDIEKLDIVPEIVEDPDESKKGDYQAGSSTLWLPSR